MVTVFANGPGGQGTIPCRVILKTQKKPPCLTLVRLIRLLGLTYHCKTIQHLLLI